MPQGLTESDPQMFVDFFRREIDALILRWTDPEFWESEGCRMDSADCAKALKAIVHPFTEGSASGDESQKTDPR